MAERNEPTSVNARDAVNALHATSATDFPTQAKHLLDLFERDMSREDKELILAGRLLLAHNTGISWALNLSKTGGA